MRFRLPSVKAVVCCVTATALSFMSLPGGPTGPSLAHRSSIATMAAPVEASRGTIASQQNNTAPDATTQHAATKEPSSLLTDPYVVEPPKRDPQTLQTAGAKLGRLRVRVVDGRTMQPIDGAEVVLIETEGRYRTDKNGYTPWFPAPIIRHPKYRPMVAELHGQLGVIAYKNGYRDSIHIGIRMHEGIASEATVWMYKIGPGDSRIEPVLYQVPYHHIWLIELADKFRRKSQIGEGYQRP